ncbi:hypothetical protein D9M69_651640 [compost metagenome]
MRLAALAHLDRSRPFQAHQRHLYGRGVVAEDGIDQQALALDLHVVRRVPEPDNQVGRWIECLESCLDGGDDPVGARLAFLAEDVVLENRQLGTPSSMQWAFDLVAENAVLEVGRLC